MSETIFIPCEDKVLTNRLGMHQAALLAGMAIAFVFSASLRAQDYGSYQDLGTLGGATGNARGVSADGKVVVGDAFDNNARQRAFRWSAADGLQNLSTLNGGSLSYAIATNQDGSVVVGGAINGFNSQMTAYRWTSSGLVMTPLGSLNGGTWSRADGVSADGTVVVGTATDGTDGVNRAFIWTTTSNTMASLGSLSAGTSSSAVGVSADGLTVIGNAKDGSVGNADRAFRWTQAGSTIVSLGTLNGTDRSYATGVNTDGSIIVGYAYDSAASSTSYTAFRWTQASNQMTSLGRLNNGNYSVAKAVNADGSVVVGNANDGADPYFTNYPRAFRWTQETGMITVEQWLRNSGVQVNDYLAYYATGVSADGNVIVGTTTSNTIYVARVVPGYVPPGQGGDDDGGGSGIIDLSQYSATIAGKPSASFGFANANTVLHGAHGEPMRNLLGEGKQSIWATTDLGYDSKDSAKGPFGLIDFGYGVGLRGGATARLGFGGIATAQDLAMGGDFDQYGFYVAPEVSLPVAGNIYATIGGYYSRSSLSINRGYLNGGLMDYARGDTELNAWGGKLRLDWLDALALGDVSFTPYASVSHVASHMDGYLETTGAFPARFDSVRDHATVLRLGLDGVYEVNQDLRLLARAEAAYRLESENAPVKGTIIGLSGFSLDGQEVDRFWVRGGIGAEFDISGGTASINLNVTTQGDDPSFWVRSGWKVSF